MADMTDPAAKERAKAVGEAMYAQDRASNALGIQVDDIAPGFARCSMTVREDMINGHDICHGGIIFTLADTAFAFACNACDRLTVALAAQITFTSPAHLNDVLIATATEQNRTQRTGVYDVKVTTEDGRDIALFRGNSYETRRSVLGAGTDRSSS
ncbi:MAG: hydroxyphenylacetyl-CoA thioesterase PaaI [Geminicoccaceae bacterium]